MQQHPSIPAASLQHFQQTAEQQRQHQRAQQHAQEPALPHVVKQEAPSGMTGAPRQSTSVAQQQSFSPPRAPLPPQPAAAAHLTSPTPAAPAAPAGYGKGAAPRGPRPSAPAGPRMYRNEEVLLFRSPSDASHLVLFGLPSRPFVHAYYDLRTVAKARAAANEALIREREGQTAAAAPGQPQMSAAALCAAYHDAHLLNVERVLHALSKKFGLVHEMSVHCKPRDTAGGPMPRRKQQLPPGFGDDDDESNDPSTALIESFESGFNMWAFVKYYSVLHAALAHREFNRVQLIPGQRIKAQMIKRNTPAAGGHNMSPSKSPNKNDLPGAGGAVLPAAGVGVAGSGNIRGPPSAVPTGAAPYGLTVAEPGVVGVAGISAPSSNTALAAPPPHQCMSPPRSSSSSTAAAAPSAPARPSSFPLPHHRCLDLCNYFLGFNNWNCEIHEIRKYDHARDQDIMDGQRSEQQKRNAQRDCDTFRMSEKENFAHSWTATVLMEMAGQTYSCSGVGHARGRDDGGDSKKRAVTNAYRQLFASLALVILHNGKVSVHILP